MVDINITIDTHGLEDRLNAKADKVAPRIERFHTDLLRIAQLLVREKAPRKTGKLKRSVSYEKKGESGLVFLDKKRASYCDWVIDGTRPHDIVPRKKKALFWQGADYPVRRVRHPGTKGQPFVDEAIPLIETRFNREAEILEKWLTEI